MVDDKESGFFLTIEGIEGAGKTTAKSIVTSWLEQFGFKFIETREPGGTPYAEQIRSLLLTSPTEDVADLTELLLMFAARSQNLAQCIEPALAAGKIVICDRFTDATYAYQGGGRGIAEHNIYSLERLVQGNRHPDMTLFLDVEPATGLARVRDRVFSAGGSMDRIEQENIDFFQRVRTVYVNRANRYPERYISVDANQSMDAVRQDIISALEKRLQ